jgi:lipopolysaccharide export system permease protein
MSRLTLYLLSQMTLTAAMTATGLTLAIWLTQSLRLLDIIVNRGLGVGIVLEILLLILPGLFAILLPIAVFIAVMFVYYRMGSDSELVVMRNAGISDLSIARPAMMFGSATMAIALILTLYGIPLSLRNYRDIQQDIGGSIAGVLIEAGVFTELAPNVTFFARDRDRSGALAGIIVEDSRDRNRPVVYTAERGAIVNAAAGPQAVLEKGTYQESNAKTGQVSVLYFDHTTVGLGALLGHSSEQRKRAMEELYPDELVAAINSQSDPAIRQRMRLELHRRITDPLYCLAMALIATACLVTSGLPRQGYNLQMLIASGLAGQLLALSFVLRSLSERSASLLPVIYVLPLVAIALALWPLSLNRMPWRTRTR